MTNINVETKTPKGAIQIAESLTPAATSGYTRGLAVAYTSGSDGQGCTLVAAQGGAILGLLAEDVVAGLPALVIEEGQTVAQIGAAVVAGAALMVNASGQLVTATSGNTVVAIAQSGNPNAGDYITVLLTPGAGAVGPQPVTYYTASGAIPVASGTAVLNGSGALAMTLATPTTPAQDGVNITIVALTAHAHTVITASDIINGTDDKVTYAAVADIIEIEAVGGKWMVKTIGGPTPAALSEV